jgi:glutathione S-transferase
MLARHTISLARGYRRLGTKPEAKPMFFDMLHSNNAARVRLWMALKKPGGMAKEIDVKMVTYPELQTASFAAINPLRKVPGLLRADGTTVFESSIILNYLEDKYSDEGPAFTPPTPEGRQEMELLCRVHDLYIASPNTTAAGFSHSQGAMYLSTGWCKPARLFRHPHPPPHPQAATRTPLRSPCHSRPSHRCCRRRPNANQPRAAPTPLPLTQARPSSRDGSQDEIAQAWRDLAAALLARGGGRGQGQHGAAPDGQAAHPRRPHMVPHVRHPVA